MKARTGEHILLLGGGGFAGQALTRRLLALGAHVQVISRRENPLPEHPRLRYHAGVVDDAERLRQLVPSSTAVFYLASNSTPGVMSQEPGSENLVNLSPLLRTLEHVLRVSPQPHWIFLSSGGTVYGNPMQSPVTERAALAPLSFHGAGKVAAEVFLRAYAPLAGTAVTLLRPSNLYGPGQPARGQFGLIRTLLDRAMNNQAIDIWGDGDHVRDYLYIDDFVDACIALLDAPPRPASTQVFNVGAGLGHSIHDVCALVERATNRRLARRHLPSRPQDVRSVVLDCTALTEATGWTARIALAEGIALHWRSLQ